MVAAPRSDGCDGRQGGPQLVEVLGGALNEGKAHRGVLYDAKLDETCFGHDRSLRGVHHRVGDRREPLGEYDCLLPVARERRIQEGSVIHSPQVGC